jgi:glycosidase
VTTTSIRPLLLVWLTIACTDPEQGPGSQSATDIATAGTLDASSVGDTAVVDTAVVDTAIVDTTVVDSAVVDTAPNQDTTAKPDTGSTFSGDTAAGDAGDGDKAASGADTDVATGPGAEPPCGSHLFAFKAPAGAKKVVVTGNWLGWSTDVAAPLTDVDADGTFTGTVKLGAGAWQYKFVADGKWFTDPLNLDTLDDGFGGKNSVIVLAACPAAIVVLSAKADHEKGSLLADIKAGTGNLDAAKVSVTIDWVKHASGCKQSAPTTCALSISGLAKGIHDVRVSSGGQTILIKVYSATTTDWRAAPIYFAMTDRFVNGDKSNDKPVGGIPQALDWRGGDFKGITDRINDGYFSDLGVGALWISWPAKQFDGAEPGGQIDQVGCNINPANATYKNTKYTAYHGYWPVSMNEVEPRFGTLEQLREMVTAAHAKGLRVLLDFTANHVHIASQVYKDNKAKGWFHLPAEVCQDVGWDKKPVTCWFTSYLADFNHSNPATRKAVIDSAVEWVKSTGADGFRLDAVKHIEMAFVEQLRARMDAEFTISGVDFYIVGETFTGDAGAIKAFVSDKRIHAQFDFPSNMQILKAFAKEEIDLTSMDNAVRGIKGVYGKHGQWMSTFLGNHDIARFFSFANGDVGCGIWDIVSNQAQGWKKPPPTTQPSSNAAYKKLLLAFTYTYVVPGIPLIYYGDEYGLAGAGDPDNRRMWAPATGHGEDLLEAMKTLGKLRASLPALRLGAWPKPLINEGHFHVLARTIGLAADRPAVLVAINRSTNPRKGQVDLKKVGITKLKTGDPCLATTVEKAAKATKCTVGSDLKLSYDVPPQTAVVYALN